MKKLAAPGRRGSVRATKFQSEHDLIEGIDYPMGGSASDSSKEQVEREASELEAAANAEAELVREREREKRAHEEVREREIALERERARREEEEKRMAEQQRQEAALAEMKRAQEAEALLLAEQQRAQAQAALEEQKRSEAAAAAAAAAALLAEQQRLLSDLEEKKRLEAAAVIIEEQKRAEEARLLEEETQRERTAHAEQARALAAARLAEQKRAEEEEAARVAEQERVRRLAEEEREKREAEEAEEAEERTAIEAARQHSEAMRLAALAQEESLLEEQRKKADEQRRKREMFLFDTSSFATMVETKVQTREEILEQSRQKEGQLFASEIRSASAGYVAREETSPVAVGEDENISREELANAVRDKILQEEAAERERQQEQVKQAKVAREREESERFVASKPVSEVAEAGGNGHFESIASSLFATASVSKSDFPEETPSDNLLAVTSGQTEAETESSSSFLSVPTRVGKPKSTVASASSASVSSPSNLAQQHSDSEAQSISSVAETTNHAEAVSSVASTDTINFDDQDLFDVIPEEEHMNLSADQKASWRAKYDDLSKKRKDFHGVVTYAYDGVFSWSMYGSTEAVDGNDLTYTEYLMRCQWGTSFDKLQPWIVAHRYSEFRGLNRSIKQQYPHLVDSLPPLPEKDYFRALDSDVISQRRAGLETYMSKIVLKLPRVLRSQLFDEFLHISERVESIKAKLASEAAATGQPALPKSWIPPGASKELSSDGSSESSEAHNAVGMQSNQVDVEQADDSLEDFVLNFEQMTVDEADARRERERSRPLDSDLLGDAELQVRDLLAVMRKLTPKQATNDVGIKKRFQSLYTLWPRLRASTIISAESDFTIIPRALQAEEDLVRAINEIKSIQAAQSLGSPLHF